MNITASQLLQIVELSFARAQTIADLINRICPLYGINTPLRLSAFLAQVIHESAAFKRKEENLNYTGKRLHEVWPHRFPNIDFARKYAGNPEALANYVYGGRMGNNIKGEGWLFRGSGFIQITGRELYQKFATYKKLEVSAIAELMRTSDEWAMDSAAWLFAVEKALLDEADRGDMIAVTRKINGCLIGQPERISYYNKAKAALI